LHGILDQFHLGFAMVLLTDLIHFVRGIAQGFFIEIQQVEVGFVGERVVGNEINGLPSRSAGDAKNMRIAAFAGYAADFIADFAGQEFGTVSHGATGAVIQQIGVDQLAKNRFAFHLIPDDHAHHLVIAGKPERLGEGATKKRRAQKVWVQLPTAKGAVRRPQGGRDLEGNFFELFEQALLHWLAQRFDDPGLKLEVFCFRGGANFEFDLFQPDLQVREKGLQVGYRYFVLAADEMKLLPFLDERVEIGGDPCGCERLNVQGDVAPAFLA
jgi:hypothetical protein